MLYAQREYQGVHIHGEAKKSVISIIALIAFFLLAGIIKLLLQANEEGSTLYNVAVFLAVPISFIVTPFAIYHAIDYHTKYNEVKWFCERSIESFLLYDTDRYGKYLTDLYYIMQRKKDKEDFYKKESYKHYEKEKKAQIECFTMKERLSVAETIIKEHPELIDKYNKKLDDYERLHGTLYPFDNRL